LDVHKATTAVVALNAEGSVLIRVEIPTTEESILSFLETLRGSIHVAFEEGTQAQWLHDLIEPRVSSVTVCRGVGSRRNKNDRLDALELARRLRLDELEPVFHRYSSNLQHLRHLVRAYETAVSDSVRTMLRLKAMFRGVGRPIDSRSLYNPKRRERWCAELRTAGERTRAGFLYDTLATLREVRTRAKREMLVRSRSHPAFQFLTSHPLIGPIRAAELTALIGSPYRFRTKRQLWAYAGFSIRTWSSSEFEVRDGHVVRKRQPMTRGLERDFNRHLKRVFKALATDLSSRQGPYGEWYRARIAAGMRSDMAKLALARKLAAVVLITWKKGERFDSDRLIRDLS
jgi:transposase